MTDPFGQFEAVQHGWRMFMHGQRRSGRTTALVNSLEDGDLVVVTDHAHGNHLKRTAYEAGKEIEIYIAPVRNLGDVITHVASRAGPRRVRFDHTWVECFIAERLYDIGEEFDWFTAQLDHRRKRFEEAGNPLQTPNLGKEPNLEYHGDTGSQHQSG